MALSVQAIVLSQKSFLFFRLDAFGHGIERKPVRDRQNDAADHLSFEIRIDA
jgi:hypothetical protein